MTVWNPVKAAWNFLKLDDPKTFKTEYIDKTIDRERKPKPAPTKWSKWNLFEAINWYPSHYSSYEKWFLFKFDVFVFFFFAASFYTKYLDQANISTAYVAGMKEELNLNGNELNYFNTCYTVGFAVFQIPICILITRPEYSRYLMVICEFTWGALTLCNAFVQNPKHVYVIRFFVGVAEACSFPATYVVFSSYLTDEELFKRAGWYGAFSSAGSASSGSLQTRTSASLHGIGGLSGWRWQFIIDAVITFGITFYGFLFYPGIPSTVKSYGALFSEDDFIFARKRLEGKISFPKKFTTKSLKETFKTWQIYACTFIWILHHQTFYDSTTKLYLKSRKDIYTQPQITDMITYLGLVGIIPAALFPPLASYYGKIPVACLGMFCAFYSGIILVIWVPENNALMLSAFAISHGFRSGMAQTYYSWIATLCKDNTEKKAIVLSVANCLAYVTNAWLIPIQWDMKNSPRFSAGFKGNIGIICLDVVAFAIMYVLDKYDLRLCPKYAGNRHTNADGVLINDPDREHHILGADSSDESVSHGITTKDSLSDSDLDKRGDVKVHALTFTQEKN
ncbi:unnamed protein product [Ambrosiozyma monospora]|uniref:Unnamed protein product n=1 Tax=Ambrosiozyma monospora TaxID=43982 RepID=A0ACB5SVY7_AMBMO|nr:unnamed protein product [Ambrosiozyma monospora]